MGATRGAPAPIARHPCKAASITRYTEDAKVSETSKAQKLCILPAPVKERTLVAEGSLDYIRDTYIRRTFPYVHLARPAVLRNDARMRSIQRRVPHDRIMRRKLGMRGQVHHGSPLRRDVLWGIRIQLLAFALVRPRRVWRMGEVLIVIREVILQEFR